MSDEFQPSQIVKTRHRVSRMKRIGIYQAAGRLMDKFRVELAVFGVCGLLPALTTKEDPSLTIRLVVVDFLSQEFARLRLASRFCACRVSARQRIDRAVAGRSGAVAEPVACGLDNTALLARFWNA